jgi:hypothetical protein
MMEKKTLQLAQEEADMWHSESHMFAHKNTQVNIQSMN